ncbi:MAG: hypothetical protein LBI01_06025, partial [Elusimicrobium sp.]|jgi:hypothetical protein|nr:hypothetical protein [Elusimicrobium sp.]
MEIVALQPDAIVKAEWVKIVAEKLDIEPQLLKTPKNAAAPAKTAQTALPAETNIPVEERDLAAWLLKAPAYITEAEHLAENKFASAVIFEIINALSEIMKNTPSTADITRELISKLPRQENIIIKLSVLPAPKEFNPTRDIKECVKKIEKSYLAKSLSALKAEIKKMPVGTVPAALLKAQNELQKQLKNS